MDNNKSGLYIVAIVGVIAVVALVVLVQGAGRESNTGQTYRVASEDAAGNALRVVRIDSESTGGMSCDQHMSKNTCLVNKAEGCYWVTGGVDELGNTMSDRCRSL